MNDKLLWDQIRNNNKLAFKKVFELYYKVMCSYIIQFTNDINEAEDIVQTTFIRLWTKRATINIRTSLKSYLFKIAYNIFIDELKKKNRQLSVLEKVKYETLLSTVEEDNFISEQRLKKIKELVNKLPQKCKEILLLSKEEGLKNKEIAVKLNISIKTVESQIRIAYKKIREGF